MIISWFLLSLIAEAKAPPPSLHQDMISIVSKMNSYEGWKSFMKEYPEHFKTLSAESPGPEVGVETKIFKINKDDYKVGVGINSVYINAKPAEVVELLNDPVHFKALYGLDKDASLGPREKDGSFKARIFKLVPGIETQDYTLLYTGHWEDKRWIQKANLVKDEKGFATRENIKIVEPHGQGSIYREVSLFYPHRWWVRLFDGMVRKITVKELRKIALSLKCASEHVSKGEKMDETLGKKCQEIASK